MAPLPSLRRPAARSHRDCAVAGATAALVGGAPSMLHALWHQRSPFDIVRAAGTLVGRPTVGAGVVVHAGVSAWWALLLCRVLPARGQALAGAAAGAAVAALDLGLAARWFPAVAALPRAPQVADHVAFGAVLGAVLGRRGAGGVLRG